MNLADYSIQEFLGMIFFLPILIWLVLVLFDGIGIFKDVFFTSNRKPR